MIAGGVELGRRPGQFVVMTKRLADPLGQIGQLVLPGAKRRLSTSHRSIGSSPPAIHSAIDLAHSARAGNPERVETGADEETVPADDRPDDGVAVRRETLRSVDKTLESVLPKAGKR